MAARAYNLAIETSGRASSVALGRGDELLATHALGEARRHNVGLMPGIDALCREHGVTPRQIGEVYLSLGPGSFTGLRVGVSTAKMLALTLGVRLVGVPTLEVLALGADRAGEPSRGVSPRSGATGPTRPGSDGMAVAVGLNLKRGTLYSAVYRDGVAIVEPALRTLDELLALSPRPVRLIAERLPEDAALPEAVTLLPPESAIGRAEVLWELGRERAKAGVFTDPASLLPLYVREPEAVTLWDERHGPA